MFAVVQRILRYCIWNLKLFSGWPQEGIQPFRSGSGCTTNAAFTITFVLTSIIRFNLAPGLQVAKPLGLLLIFENNGQTVYSKGKLTVDHVTLSVNKRKFRS